MEKAHSNGGLVAFAAGLYGGEGSRTLQNHLRGFKHAVAGDFCAEAAGACEGFNNAVRTHASKEGLVGKLLGY